MSILTRRRSFVACDLPNVQNIRGAAPLVREMDTLISVAVMCEGSFNGTSPSRDVMGSTQPDPGPIAGGRESPDQFPENRVKPLHVAALVLAIAALISVLAACYVITRSGNFYHFAPTVNHSKSCLCETERERGVESHVTKIFVISARETCIDKTCILRRQVCTYVYERTILRAKRLTSAGQKYSSAIFLFEREQSFCNVLPQYRVESRSNATAP